MKPIRFPQLEGNGHLAELEARFGDLRAGIGALENLAAPDRRIVMLCFTNRCGSNYLASSLASDGRLNMAREVLNTDYVDETRAQTPGFAGFMAQIFADNHVHGRWAVKVGCPHLEILGASGLLELWRDRIDYIFIERADRLAQAISWEIAVQTGQWDWTLPAAGEPIYDRARIEGALQLFADFNRSFDLFFGTNGIVPAHVVYENYVADPPAVVRRVGDAIGLPGLVYDPRRVSTRRQAGSRNAEWRARYLNGQ